MDLTNATKAITTEGKAVSTPSLGMQEIPNVPSFLSLSPFFFFSCSRFLSCSQCWTWSWLSIMATFLPQIPETNIEPRLYLPWQSHFSQNPLFADCLKCRGRDRREQVEMKAKKPNDLLPFQWIFFFFTNTSTKLCTMLCCFSRQINHWFILSDRLVTAPPPPTPKRNYKSKSNVILRLICVM